MIFILTDDDFAAASLVGSLVAYALAFYKEHNRAKNGANWCVSDVFNWVTVVFSAAGSLKQVVCISCSASHN